MDSAAARVDPVRGSTSDRGPIPWLSWIANAVFVGLVAVSVVVLAVSGDPKETDSEAPVVAVRLLP